LHAAAQGVPFLGELIVGNSWLSFFGFSRSRSGSKGILIAWLKRWRAIPERLNRMAGGDVLASALNRGGEGQNALKDFA